MPLDPVRTALAIKRSHLRLRDLPAGEQPAVRAVLNAMTDAQAGTIARASEFGRHALGRTHAQSRNAGS